MAIGTSLLVAALCLGFSLIVDASKNKDCDCSGPTNYYKELGCTPVFKNPGDCCPIRYDCSVLSNLANDECLVNGHVYTMSERIRDEDANTCDWCTCAPLSDSTVHFRCAVPGCASPELPNESCHYVATDSCCGFHIICPKEDGSFATCVVDGKTYSDGDQFVPSAEPHKRCRCMEGYIGENVEPYCVSPKHTWCNNVIHAQTEIRYCAPVYSMGISLKTGCNQDFRCPTGTDFVIERTNENGTDGSAEPDMLCRFGNFTMRVGEELNEDPSYNVKCVCEVPPIPTCRTTVAST